MKLALIVLAAIAVLGVAGMLVYVYVIQNVEQPDYSLVRKDGDFEIRDYPPLVVAEVTRSGSRDEALSAGFRPLAGYIFAKERGGGNIAMTAPVTQQAVGADEKIAMTAPVTQQPAGNGEWTVRFIMPAEYSLADLPRPAGDGVRLDEVPARSMAVVRFSGRADNELIAEQEQRLRDWMAEQGVEPRGEPVYAYYNDPFTPGFLRRNEVMIPMAAEPQSM